MEKSDTKENIIIHTHRERVERRREKREREMSGFYLGICLGVHNDIFAS